MKRILCIAFLLGLVFTACQKNKPETEKDFKKALKKYLCSHTWLLDLDNLEHKKANQASYYFSDKPIAFYTFKNEKNTYELKYTNQLNDTVVEIGTWSVTTPIVPCTCSQMLIPTMEVFGPNPLTITHL
ncbi:MAG TPA: hypothetical protein VK177_19890 [Flavobacteriales bacterium]|nr:hypothetical protein [Flavobacteriales bacterium]